MKPKSPSHSDEREDKALIKKMVKPADLKGAGKSPPPAKSKGPRKGKSPNSVNGPL